MKLTVQNFKLIEHAEIELSPRLTLIGGKNTVGKSSVAHALSIVACGEEVKKAQALRWVRHGAQAALIELVTGSHGACRIALPAQTVRDGGAFSISAYAAGRLSLLTTPLKDGERSKAWSRYILAQPTEKDFIDAFAAVSESELNYANAAWNGLKQSTWDDAWDFRCKDRARMKGQWEQVTKEKRWGSDKAVEWTPQGWDSELATKTEQELESNLFQARKLLEEALQKKGVAENERAALEALVVGKAEHVKKQESANQERLTAEKKLEAETAKLTEIAKTHPSNVQVAFPCFSCGEMQVFKDGKSQKPDENRPTPEDLARASKEIDAQKAIIQRLTKQRDDAAAAFAIESAAITEAYKAEKRLEESAADVSAETVERCRTQVAQEEKRVALFKQWSEATTIQRRITLNERVIDLLDPRGLRKTILERALELVNLEIKTLCEKANWEVFKINPDLEAEFEDCLYEDFSESLQWRVRTVLQVWCAMGDGSKFTIHDAADILDRDHLNGLISLLGDRMAVIFKKCEVSDNGYREIPDFSDPRIGLGKTYWVEGNTVLPLSQPVHA